MTLFGATAFAQGAVLATTDPGLGAWLTLLGGAVVLTVAGVSLLGDEDGADPDGALFRTVAVGGAFLYTAVTVFRLV